MTQEITYVSKGWGFEKIITNTEKYCCKILHFHKNKQCSYHYHRLKDELFYVLSGKLSIRYGEGDEIEFSKILNAGDSFHVPIGMRHQMFAIEETDLLEVSTQDFTDDSYRIIKGD